MAENLHPRAQNQAQCHPTENVYYGVFAVLIPAGEDRLSPEEQALFDERQEARRRREFARADEARRRLEEMGITLEDTPKGTRWRRRR